MVVSLTTSKNIRKHSGRNEIKSSRDKKIKEKTKNTVNTYKRKSVMLRNAVE